MNKTKKWLGLGLSVLSVSVLVACGAQILSQIILQKKLRQRKSQQLKKVVRKISICYW